MMIRAYLNNERTSFGSTGIFVQPNMWDTKSSKIKGRTTEALRLNQQLDNIKNHIVSLFNNMEFDECLSLELIKSKYLGKKTEMDTILDLFNSHIANCNKLVGTSITITAVRKYDVCKRHFMRFLQEEYRRSDLLLKEITPAVINDFDIFLRTVIRHNHNTANKTMKTLKTIILLGRNLGLINSDPYINYKPHTIVSKRSYLTEEELMQIISRDMPVERLNLIRDVFIFSCFTGLAFVDIYYTSASIDQQTIDMYVEDNFGQTVKLSFEFNSQKDEEKEKPNENKK